jgi:broad specificity phosphatase PhoE
MSRLLLVRHGETDAHAAGRFCGWLDVPLNAEGQAQAIALGQRLAGVEIAAAFSSDLRRSVQTTELILAARSDDLKLQSLASLRETNFGVGEGLTWAEIRSQFPIEASTWQADKVNQSLPEGESLTEVAERLRSVLPNLIAADATSLVVAHGGTIGLLLSMWMGLELGSFWQWRIDVGSLTTIAIYPQGAILEGLNCRSHWPGSSGG